MTTPNGSADFAEQPKGLPAQEVDFANLSDEELAATFDKAPAPNQVEAQAPAPDAKPEPPKAELAVAEGQAEVAKEQAAEIKPEQSAESLQKQLTHLQSLYGRQSNELGRLRAQLKGKPTQEDYDNDPVKATEQLQEHKATEQEIVKLEKEQEVTSIVKTNIEFAQQYAPDLEANAQAIYNLLVTEDKVPPTEAQKFLSQIYLYNPYAVFHLNQRARLVKEHQALKSEIDKLKAAPGQVVNKIAGVNKAVPAVSAATGQSSAPSGIGLAISEADLATMSDADLESALKSNLKKER
jgi:hypothetical protein